MPLPRLVVRCGSNKCGRSSQSHIPESAAYADSFYLESLKGRIEHPASETSFNRSFFREMPGARKGAWNNTIMFFAPTSSRHYQQRKNSPFIATRRCLP
jgi:hypothetical protein